MTDIKKLIEDCKPDNYTEAKLLEICLALYDRIKGLEERQDRMIVGSFNNGIGTWGSRT